jgi:hypothetical protein
MVDLIDFIKDDGPMGIQGLYCGTGRRNLSFHR